MEREKDPEGGVCSEVKGGSDRLGMEVKGVMLIVVSDYDPQI